MANPITRWIDKRIQRGVEERLKATRGGPSVGVILEGETQQIPTIICAGDDDAVAKAERFAVASAWAMSDIREIGNEYSRAPFQVIEKTGEGEEQIEAHPFEMVLDQPNKFMGQSFLWQATNWWLQLRGEAYWWTVPDATGEIAEIWPIPSSRMRPIPDPRKYISHYGYTPRKTGREIPIPAEVVCFFRFFNPFDFHRGLSPLSAANSGLKTDYKAARWNYETFDQDVTLRTAISLDKEINPRDFAVLKDDLIDELVNKRLRYLITRAGDVDVKQLGLSQKDAEFLAGRAFSRDEIDRAFGFPSGYWAKDANRANAEAAKATLIEGVVYPLHVLTAEFITAQVIIPRYGENLRGKFEDIRPRDRALQVQERKVNWQVFKVNEARKELGKEPLEEMDERGELLVPEIRGRGFGGGLFGDGGNDERDEQDTGSKEAKADLRRWEKIARRLVREGGNPAGYDFQSNHITPLVAARIKAALFGATTEEEVKAAFAAGFQGAASDWDGYG